MTRNTWAVLSRLLDDALDVPPDDRTGWVDGLGPEHDAIRTRLRRLVQRDTRAAAPLLIDTIPKVDRRTDEARHEPDDREAPLEPVGPYRVLRLLGEGGMGSVWLAERADGMVKRPVALKLPRGAWGRRELAERMAREREILATLEHPNIARLYDAGLTSAGQPYLALEYVDGCPLDVYARTRKLSVRARLTLFLQVARAVAHAHARLIVHRDLKPSNVLVTDAGEVRLLDFGIATLLADRGEDAEAVTDIAGRPLTPDYASPEHIAGRPLGVASDVYSLGVLLYELLTDVRPYTVRRARGGGFEPPVALAAPRRPSEAVVDPLRRRALRGDLDTIVLKALRHVPDERYATVDAFAEDIERHLEGHAVLARPVSRRYRFGKFLARHKAAAAAVAAVVTAVLSGASLAIWQAHLAFSQKARAEEVRDFLATVLEEASPYKGGASALSATDWLKRMKARVDRRLDRPELRVELLNIVGSSLLTLQDTASAESVLTQAVREADQYLGPDHVQTLRARVLLTPVHRFRGRTREMRAELAQLLPVLRARAAELAEPLVIALKNQAHLEIDEGRYQQAEAAAQEAVDVGVARLGARHPETVASLLIRAYAYQFSRPPDEAVDVSERAYHNALAIHDGASRHPRVIEGRLLYGRALGLAGQLDRSVTHLSQAVDDAAVVFGASSRMVGFFSLPLSRFQLELGQVRESLENSRRALAIIATHTQPDSFRYAVALHARGAALLASQRAAEALPDLAAAADTIARSLSPAHPMARDFRADQALALAALGRPADARQLIDDLPGDGAAHSEAQASSRPLYALGVATRLAGNPREALRLQQQSLDALPSGRRADVDRLRVLTELGLDLHALAQPERAAVVLEQALALSRRRQTAGPDRANILVALGRTLLALNRTVAAEPLLREAQDFWRAFDRDSPKTAEVARWLDRCRMSDGDSRVASEASTTPPSRLAGLPPSRLDVVGHSANRREPHTLARLP